MGGIRLCNEMVRKYWPKDVTIYISNPTWGPHRGMPTLMGLNWKEYRYYDEKNICVDFEGMCEDLRAAPEGSLVLL